MKQVHYRFGGFERDASPIANIEKELRALREDIRRPDAAVGGHQLRRTACEHVGAEEARSMAASDDRHKRAASLLLRSTVTKLYRNEVFGLMGQQLKALLSL